MGREAAAGHNVVAAGGAAVRVGTVVFGSFVFGSCVWGMYGVAGMMKELFSPGLGCPPGMIPPTTMVSCAPAADSALRDAVGIVSGDPGASRTAPRLASLVVDNGVALFGGIVTAAVAYRVCLRRNALIFLSWERDVQDGKKRVVRLL